MRLLLVEDDYSLAHGLIKALSFESFIVDHVASGKEALHVAATGEINIVILDLGLPDMDGMEVLKRLRSQNKQLPVLVLTARVELDDRVAGLDLGADDYLAKPFDMPELLARLRVIERRLGTSFSNDIVIKDVSLNTASHTLLCNEQTLDVSRKEFMVLKALMENAGKIQTREQLETKLYAWGEEVASNAVEVHIHHLRKKLPPQFIKTIRGVGYIVNKS
jgi:DNA-binding response OmpR family regulator